MIITLSPAKILDFNSEVIVKDSTIPLYQGEATELYSLLKGVSVEDIASLMKVNPQLALSTYEYINSFDLPQTASRQAAFAFNGMVYQGLDVATFNKEDFNFAQNHLVLFSGLYGMLRPLDLIKPYRLELQTKLVNNKGSNLYDFWKDTLTKHMAKVMSEGSNVWVNLTSKEYEKVIDKKKLPKGYKQITPVFKEARGEGYKQIVVYAKKARGMMARFIIQNQIEDSEHLKAFDCEGYGYSPQLSTDKEWVFIR